MYESIPEFYRASLESEHGRVRDQDVPDRAPRQGVAPLSTQPSKRAPGVPPGFVVIWEWQR